MGRANGRPVTLRLLMAALVFQGLSAIAGGYGLVSDPTGRALGIPSDWLQGSPFADYLIPGLILLLVLGLFPLVVVYGLWARNAWSWRAALLVGVALVGWIVVEILIIGYVSHPPLQLVYGLLGIIILLLTLVPSVRQWLMDGQRPA